MGSADYSTFVLVEGEKNFEVCCLVSPLHLERGT
jgi:hypothetical protein